MNKVSIIVCTMLLCSGAMRGMELHQQNPPTAATSQDPQTAQSSQESRTIEIALNICQQLIAIQEKQLQAIRAKIDLLILVQKDLPNTPILVEQIQKHQKCMRLASRNFDLGKTELQKLNSQASRDITLQQITNLLQLCATTINGNTRVLTSMTIKAIGPNLENPDFKNFSLIIQTRATTICSLFAEVINKLATIIEEKTPSHSLLSQRNLNHIKLAVKTTQEKLQSTQQSQDSESMFDQQKIASDLIENQINHLLSLLPENETRSTAPSSDLEEDDEAERSDIRNIMLLHLLLRNLSTAAEEQTSTTQKTTASNPEKKD